MPVETATFISDLNTSNPAHSDGLNQADAHMRLIKAALKATFGGLIGPLVNAASQIIPADGSSTKPAYSFASEPTLGLYRSAPGVISITGGKLKALPVGAVFMFPIEPPSLGKATTDTGKDYLELNGATYNTADYPDLAAFFGASGTTFTLPNAYDTGRFPRSRTATVSASTAQSNQNKTHTHTGSGNTGTESADHTHFYSGTTGGDSPDHTHAYSAPQVNSSTGGGSFGTVGSGSGASTGGASTRHTHAYSGNTGGRSAAHTHAYSFTTSAGTADGDEARPEALALVFAIKT